MHMKGCKCMHGAFARIHRVHPTQPLGGTGQRAACYCKYSESDSLLASHSFSSVSDSKIPFSVRSARPK